MNVLFITRKYPPQIGGMEEFSEKFFLYLKGDKKIIALKKSQLNLIWFLPYAFIRAVLIAPSVDIIHLGDGALGLLGLLLKKVTKKPVTATVHGLDITFKSFWYQRMIVRSIAKLDHVFTVSNNTKNLAIAHGISKKSITVILNGVETTLSPIQKGEAKKIIFEKYSVSNYHGKSILLTTGRLVKRKGHAWFIEEVLPHLNENVIYIIAGTGREEKNIKEVATQSKRKASIYFTGSISENTKVQLYKTADLFIMPNQPILNSVEGFGIVALEAATQGTPVIASNIEGLKDAITPKTGFLIPPTPTAFIEKISFLQKNPKIIQSFQKSSPKEVAHSFSWEKSLKLYQEKFNTIT